MSKAFTPKEAQAPAHSKAGQLRTNRFAEPTRDDEPTRVDRPARIDQPTRHHEPARSE